MRLTLYSCLFTILIFAACKNERNRNPYAYISIGEEEIILSPTEMNGVSFENVKDPIGSLDVQPIVDVNANWVTTMPFGFITSNSDLVQYNHTWQWHGEKRAGVIENINLCHAQGLKVMVKPHIWAIGKWIGDVTYETEEEWQNFEDSYIEYAVDFAKISDSLDVETYCIGVEMKQVVINRPEFWAKLIQAVKEVYSGPITYAANWDNYQNVNFWDQLDFIGVDAYFPLSEEQTPSVEDCYLGWETTAVELEAYSIAQDRKVIFTEFGFRNVDFTGKEPWALGDNPTFNSKAQENAYKATFAQFWGEDWFEGGFLWKWHPNHSEAGGFNNNRFTPQNKLAQSAISEVFDLTRK